MARIRHRLAALGAALMILLAAVPFVAAEDGGTIAFVSGIEDLPLMPGLEEAPEGALVFDTPAGRIVEAYASGPVPKDTVLAFYDDTLVQLGWSGRGDGVYVREGELLRIEVPETQETDGATTVHFALAPEDTSQQR